MKQFLLAVILGSAIVATGTVQAHWGPYHYLTFEADGEGQTIRVKGSSWQCSSKHRYDLHWSEKFIKCSD